MSPLELIHQWYRNELSIPYPHVTGARLLTGCPLWGDPYVPRFCNWTLPSMLASHTALSAIGWELVLYVDPPAWHALNPLLHAWRIPVQFRCIPAPVMDIMHRGGVSKYWLLAAIHNVLVHEAGRRGAAFHMLVGDIVYNDGYFDRLFRLSGQSGCDGIAQTGLTIANDGAAPLLNAYRGSDGILRVPARDLGQVGWANIVGEWGSWTMDDIDDPAQSMPNAHFLWWRGDDHVRIHTAHQSAVWISPERCARLDAGLGGTIDSELPRYIGQNFRIPGYLDDMSCVALDDGRGVPTPRIGFAEFRKSLLDLIAYRQDFMEYFRTPCIVPARPTDGFPSSEALDLRFQHLLRLIEEQPSGATA